MKLVELKVVYDGWTKVSVGRFRGDGVPEFRREIEDHGSAAAVLPYDAARKCALLVRQFRAPVFARAGEVSFLEAAAGLLDDDDPETCARREAFEEMGVRLTTLERVGAVAAMPGLSTEVLHLFVAPYVAADRVGPGGGMASEHERVEVIEMPLGELAAMADAGTLSDMKTLAMVQTLRLRKPSCLASAALSAAGQTQKKSTRFRRLRRLGEVDTLGPARFDRVVSLMFIEAAGSPALLPLLGSAPRASGNCHRGKSHHGQERQAEWQQIQKSIHVLLGKRRNFRLHIAREDAIISRPRKRNSQRDQNAPEKHAHRIIFR